MALQPSPNDAALPAIARGRIDALLQSGERRLLGLVGPPGAGKSTLAARIHAEYPDQTVVVPMDGFHLATVQLQRLGRQGRKGAPDTFDAHGYTALLRRLKQPQAGEVVYGPDFRREIEEPIAGAIAVAPEVPLVIAEGNYLLLEDEPWPSVRELLDEVWYVDVDKRLRLSRLQKRHEAFGRSPADAQAWIAGTDEPNARRIEACRARAHWVFNGSDVKA